MNVLRKIKLWWSGPGIHPSHHTYYDGPGIHWCSWCQRVGDHELTEECEKSHEKFRTVE